MPFPSGTVPRPHDPADSGAAFVAWPYVDTLYDYTQLLGPDRVMGTIPPAKQGARVAIIGAGAAGMVAAYELLRIGVDPVVFEATRRIGGRGWSQHFTEKDGSEAPEFAEMGAMRVPTSNKTFGYYASLFEMKPTLFPDPGVAPTLLYYENVPYTWEPGAPPPGPFARINQQWGEFITPYLTSIWTPWKLGDLEGVRRVWQSYIDRFADQSFYEALRAGLPSWTTQDFNAFGALGVGSGGFGPFYPQGFLELLRLLVNMWETDQQLYLGGINELTDGFYTRRVRSPRHGLVSLSDRGAVQLRTAVRRIEYDPERGKPILTVEQLDEGTKQTLEFDAVIMATTSYAMELTGLTMESGPRNVIDQPVKNALRTQHLTCSSKLFIRTETKFWKDDPGIPQTIQTDQLPRGVYLLDYPSTERGVVLVSYAWADDSVLLQAVPPRERFALLKQQIAVICPALAAQLVPMDGEILNIDWQSEPYYHGAFKLQLPGQEPFIRDANYQFLTANDPANDRGVYLAGDTVSWSGGWTEGALQTGLNAVSAVIKRIGGEPVAGSPLTQNPHLYFYSSFPFNSRG